MKQIRWLMIFFLVLVCCGAEWEEKIYVYLKNGQVMVGRMVARNSESIVLQSEDSQELTSSTIFWEDINRIESEEQYERKKKLVPFQLFEQKKYTPLGTFSLGSAVDSRQAIEELLRQNQRLNAQDPAPFSGQMVHPSLWGQSSQTVTSRGVIAGEVRLHAWDTKTKGDLFVYLMKRQPKGGYLPLLDARYTRIPSEDIRSSRVSYVIEGISPGLYGVFAQWDIKPPYFEESVAGGQKVLKNYYSPGDFMGGSEKEILIRENEVLSDVVVHCGTEVPLSESVSVRAAPYQIEDVYYLRENKRRQLFLRLRNTAQVPLLSVTLEIVFNKDESTAQEVVVAGPINPGANRDISVTSVYVAYLKAIGEEEAQRISSSDGLEKIHVQVFDKIEKELLYEKILIVI